MAPRDPRDEHVELRTLFQPIVDGRTGSLFAYEALTRGPAGTPLESPDALFARARAQHELVAFDLQCAGAALDAFAACDPRPRLFLNILPSTLVAHGALQDWLAAALVARRLATHDVVLELTEHGLDDDGPRLLAATRDLRAAGFEFAIDDLGAGSSGLRTWTELQPDYVKLDRYFVSSVDVDPVRAEMLRSILDIAHVMGSRIVAEGVETEGQYLGVLDLGVDYLQGHFIARPAAPGEPGTALQRPVVRPGAAAVITCAEQLAVALPAVETDTRIGEVAEAFLAHRDRAGLAVVERGRPVGLVRRDDLLTLLSKPLHPEIYNRKPVTAVMDPGPLVIDGRARLDQLSRILTGRAATSRMDELFIVTRGGRYLGLGSGLDLLRQITAQQVNAARHCNPLTQLPGNRQIEEELNRLIGLGRGFHVAYLDIDRFKPYNDHYGYAQGDRVLLELAELVKQGCYPRVDFAGHIGGDDFILVLRSPGWQHRLRRLVDNFDASVRRWYSDAHLVSRTLRGCDRDGQARDFPLMTLSVAVVEVVPGRHRDAAMVSMELREVKHLAKARDGHALLACAADGRIADFQQARDASMIERVAALD